MLGNDTILSLGFQNLQNRLSCYTRRQRHGEVAEWLIALVSKASLPRGNGGSNPPLSAMKIKKYPRDKRGYFSFRLVPQAGLVRSRLASQVSARRAVHERCFDIVLLLRKALYSSPGRIIEFR